MVQVGPGDHSVQEPSNGGTRRRTRSIAAAPASRNRLDLFGGVDPEFGAFVEVVVVLGLAAHGAVRLVCDHDVEAEVISVEPNGRPPEGETR